MHEAFQIAVRTGVGFDLDFGLDWCGQLCTATGRYAEALTLWAALAATLRHDGFVDVGMDARYRCGPLHKARQALGPVQARAAEDRGAAMSRARAVEYALMLTSSASRPLTPGPGPRAAQPARTAAGHPGRPGPHRRPDRRRAVHQHPHRPLPPGPDPGQDRLPPPRRPDPPGSGRRTGLARTPRPARLWVVLPRPPRWCEKG